MNPYLTTPSMLSGDSWSQPVMAWLDHSMHQGPLWVLLLSSISFITKSLLNALLILKLVFIAVLIVSGVILLRLIKNKEGNEKVILFTLLAWNPYIFQYVLIDAHSDILVLFSILCSYYFLREKRFCWSTCALLLGGFIKYTPLLLLPIPLWYLIQHHRKQPKMIATALFKIASFCAVLFTIAYLFFQSTPLHSRGLVEVTLQEGAPAFSPLGVVMFQHAFNLSYFDIRVLGIALAFLVLLFYIKKNNPLAAYTVPYLVFFVFGAGWFWPWYMLWILPLLALMVTLDVFVVLSVLLLLIPEVMSPSDASLLFMIIVSPYFLLPLISATANYFGLKPQKIKQ
jgi:hypothetical protein